MVTIFKIVEDVCLVSIQCFPKASVQFFVPFNTMSITVSKALADSLSVGEMKFPAALFSKTSTFPNVFNTSCNMFST
ncbi:hypothetical protein D3C87_1716170 [compost metagenome]